MNLPGFAAEASVYKTTGQYCGAATFSISAGQVLPATCCSACPCDLTQGWECPPENPECWKAGIVACVECLRNCQDVCTPSCGPCQKIFTDTTCQQQTLPCDGTPEITGYYWCTDCLPDPTWLGPAGPFSTQTCYGYGTNYTAYAPIPPDAPFPPAGDLSLRVWTDVCGCLPCNRLSNGLQSCSVNPGWGGGEYLDVNCNPPPCVPSVWECYQTCVQEDCCEVTVPCS